MMSKHIISEIGIKVDQVLIKETLKLPTLISIQQTQSLFGHQKNYENIVSPWYGVLAQYTLLVPTNHCRAFYEHFFAMMTKLPDWPCLL